MVPIPKKRKLWKPDYDKADPWEDVPEDYTGYVPPGHPRVPAEVTEPPEITIPVEEIPVIKPLIPEIPVDLPGSPGYLERYYPTRKPIAGALAPTPVPSVAPPGVQGGVSPLPPDAGGNLRNVLLRLFPETYAPMVGSVGGFDEVQAFTDLISRANQNH